MTGIFVVAIVFHLIARAVVKIVCYVVWLAHFCGHVVDVCVCVCAVGVVVGRIVVVAMLLVVVVGIEDVLIGTIVG